MAIIPKNPAAKTVDKLATETKAAETKTPAAAAAAPAGPLPGNEPGPAASTAAADTAASTGTALAAPASTAVARVAGRPVDVLERDFKNALPLEWNTLHRIMVNQGQFLDKEDGNKPLGSQIVLKLLSYQDSWQISPGVQGAEAAEFVRYSDDGILTTQGENCQEYLQALKAAEYTDAKMTKRVVLGGVIQACDNAAMVGKMVQMDLSQTSKNLYDRHRLQIALDVSQGRRTSADGLNLLKMGTKVETKNGNTWTMATFDYATPAAAAAVK